MGAVYHTVDSVIVLHDETTGRTINKDVCFVKDSQERRAIYKGNGIYIFLGDRNGDTNVVVESEFYQTKTIFISKEEKNPMYHIWLMPSCKNDKLCQMSVYQTKIKPYENIRFILQLFSLPYRLIGDLKKGDTQIRFYHLPYDDVEGRSFRLFNGKAYEDIKLVRKISGIAGDEEPSYLLEKPIRKAYNPEQTKIYPISEATADKDGTVLAAFRDTVKQGSECLAETEKEKWTIKLEYRKTD